MLSIGQVLQGRYHVVAMLGHGGMGAVYRAFDDRLNADCVVKEMLVTPETLAHAADAAEQFKREAAVLAMLRHPNLPRVIDHFSERDNNYLVMDFIEGRNLHKMIGAQGMPEAVALTYAKQLLDVLDYIHGHGVVHRDIKPANIIIRPDGQAVLVDFGLVKLFTLTGNNTTKTFLRGVGTPEYAPPEQHTGGTDQRSDLYSLGGTLYQALTGHAPVNAIDRASGLNMPGIREINPAVSARTEQVVLKAMSLRRDMRYPDAVTMRAELDGAIPPNVPGTVVLLKPIQPIGKGTKTKWIGALIAIAAGLFVIIVATIALRGNGDTTAPAALPTPVVLVAEVTSTQAAIAAQSIVPAPTGTPISTNTTAPSVTAPPSPTPQPFSTPKPTSTQSPTATPVTPTSTPTPSPTPTDTCSPKWFFSPAPTNEGCLQNMRSVAASVQVYEKGRILWLDDAELSNKVFVFYSNGVWASVAGSIDSVGSAPDQVNLLGQPTGARGNFTTCAAHSNANGVVTAYVSDAGANVLSWSISTASNGSLGWRYIKGAQVIGCG